MLKSSACALDDINRVIAELCVLLQKLDVSYIEMAQNQLNDLMEERVYPIVTSIRGFFGSFG